MSEDACGELTVRRTFEGELGVDKRDGATSVCSKLRLVPPDVEPGEISDHIDVVEVFVGEGNANEFSRVRMRENDSDSSSVANTAYLELTGRVSIK